MKKMSLQYMKHAHEYTQIVYMHERIRPVMIANVGLYMRRRSAFRFVLS